LQAIPTDLAGGHASMREEGKAIGLIFVLGEQ
jgi:hypothetical protein